MKRSKLLLLGLAVLLVTGCSVKADYGIKIDKNKDVKLEFVTAYDNDMIDTILGMENTSSEEKEYTDTERWTYLEKEYKDKFKDFEKSKYEVEEYKGYTYKLDLGNIDNLITEDDSKVDFENVGKDSKIFTKDGKVYTLKLRSSDKENQQMSQYASSIGFDVKLRVILPNKAKSSNATTVEGNTYIWDLTQVSDIDLSFAIDEGHTSSMIMRIGCALAAAGISISTIALMQSKKKKK